MARGRHLLLARFDRRRSDCAARDRRLARRLVTSARRLGRTRRLESHRGDPRVRCGNQIRRRLSAGFDRQGTVRGVFAWARIYGALARARGQGGARAQEGGVMRRPFRLARDYFRREPFVEGCSGRRQSFDPLRITTARAFQDKAPNDFEYCIEINGSVDFSRWAASPHFSRNLFLT
jgi:hypothetical protein